nr:reverse transcriptase domain-containing protein [Tanacetum cinerariifolium]
DGLDGKLAGLLKASKNLDHLIESQRSDQVKEEVGYNVVSPPAADLYLSPKKDLSWTGLPEFVDDTVTDYSRPSPTILIIPPSISCVFVEITYLSIVYGKACQLPIELEHKAYWALKQTNFDLSVAGDHRKIQLNELNELRDHAYENSLIYKEKR